MAMRRTFLQVEELGPRVLPSTSPLFMPILHREFDPGLHREHIALGHGHGAYSTDAIQFGAGPQYQLHGVAAFPGLGRVTVQGSVNSVGFIAEGHAGGTLTFSNAHGSVTVELQGPQQAGFSALPQQFSYSVIGATGTGTSLKTDGTLDLVLSAGHAALAGGDGLIHGSFTLAIV